MRAIARRLAQSVDSVGQQLILGRNAAAAAARPLERLRSDIGAAWDHLHQHETDPGEGLYPWELAVIDRFVKPADHLLVVGCGNGRDLFPLIARGCRVTGLDPATRAIDECRAALATRQLEARLIRGFVDDEDLRLEGPFDCVIFSYFTYSYIPVAARRVRALRRVAAQLTQGGTIVLSHQRMLRPRALVTRAARLAGALAGSDWRFEPGDVAGRVRAGDRVCYTFGHAFTADEIHAEARAADLRLIHTQEGDEESVYVLTRSYTRCT